MFVQDHQHGILEQAASLRDEHKTQYEQDPNLESFWTSLQVFKQQRDEHMYKAYQHPHLCLCWHQKKIFPAGP
jgi:hypothetical protein